MSEEKEAKTTYRSETVFARFACRKSPQNTTSEAAVLVEGDIVEVDRENPLHRMLVGGSLCDALFEALPTRDSRQNGVYVVGEIRCAGGMLLPRADGDEGKEQPK